MSSINQFLGVGIHLFTTEAALAVGIEAAVYLSHFAAFSRTAGTEVDGITFAVFTDKRAQKVMPFFSLEMIEQMRIWLTDTGILRAEKVSERNCIGIDTARLEAAMQSHGENGKLFGIRTVTEYRTDSRAIEESAEAGAHAQGLDSLSTKSREREININNLSLSNAKRLQSPNRERDSSRTRKSNPSPIDPAGWQSLCQEFSEEETLATWKHLAGSVSGRMPPNVRASGPAAYRYLATTLESNRSAGYQMAGQTQAQEHPAQAAPSPQKPAAQRNRVRDTPPRTAVPSEIQERISNLKAKTKMDAEGVDAIAPILGSVLENILHLENGGEQKRAEPRPRHKAKT